MLVHNIPRDQTATRCSVKRTSQDNLHGVKSNWYKYGESDFQTVWSRKKAAPIRATMGAALYRTRTASSLLSQSVRDHAMSYAEAEHLNHDTDRVVDIYGNIIFSAEPEQQRRASMDDHDHHVSTLPAQDLTGKSSPSLLLNTASTLSNVFTTPNPQANFAYECLQCSWLVCVSCRDAVITAQNMKNES
jgi:hypothetical protein